MASMISAAPRIDVEAWQSILFVPVLNERYIAKACTSAADAVQLDLEDSILPADKARARALLSAAARQLHQAGKPVSVRINQPLELAVPDIQATVAADAHALMLPKVVGPDHVRLLDEMVGRLEDDCQRQVGSLRFIVVIETPDAYHRMHEIFRSSPRIAGAMLGNEDFAQACHCDPGEETMRYYKAAMVAAARAAGVKPLGTLGSIANFADKPAYEAMVRRSRAAGFHGTTCIHPSQVDIVNTVYGPNAERLDWARRVVTLADEAAARGNGAFQLDGRMVDAPIVERARSLLKAAEQTSTKER